MAQVGFKALPLAGRSPSVPFSSALHRSQSKCSDASSESKRPSFLENWAMYFDVAQQKSFILIVKYLAVSPRMTEDHEVMHWSKWLWQPHWCWSVQAVFDKCDFRAIVLDRKDCLRSVGFQLSRLKPFEVEVDPTYVGAIIGKGGQKLSIQV